MSDTESPTIEAAQLIYTNVEADRSPTKKRGFQVWLYTPTLSDGVRRTIEKRLEDFKLPRPTEDPTRLAFFQLPEDGRFVVARTRKLAGVDKFGRGGRFFAHALVIEPAQFANIGNNPFRIFDLPESTFPFKSEPSDLLSDDDDIQAALEVFGTCRLAVPAGPPTKESPRSGIVPALLPKLVPWLSAGLEGILAFPATAEESAQLLRVLFERLPPPLRAEFSFDTLSTGRSLAKIPYRFAGAHSVDALRRWTFKRYILLNPETGAASLPEPVDERQKAFAALAVIFTEAGAAWDDRRREAAVSLVSSVIEGRVDSESRDNIDQETFTCLCDSIPGFNDRLEKLVRGVFKIALPHNLLRELPEVQKGFHEWLGEPGFHQFKKINQAPEQRQIDGWILKAYEDKKEPSSEELKELREWLKGRTGDSVTRLKLIRARWSRSVEKLRQFTTEASPEQLSWFRTWLFKTLPANFFDTKEAQYLPLREALMKRDSTQEHLLQDTEIFFLLRDKEESPELRPPGETMLRLLLDVKSEEFDLVKDLVNGLMKRDQEQMIANWLDTLGIESQEFCWYSEETFYLGYLLWRAGDDGSVLDILQALWDTQFRDQLFGRYVVLESASEEAYASPVPKKERTEWRKQIRGNADEGSWKAIAAFAGKDPTRFRFVADFLFKAVCHTSEGHQRPTVTSTKDLWRYPDSIAVCVKVGYYDYDASVPKKLNNYLSSLLRSTITVCESDVNPATGPWVVDPHRFRWLLTCLLHPAKYEYIHLEGSGTWENP